MTALDRRLFKAAFLGAAANMALVAIALVGWQAVADQNPATDGVPRVVPYNGVMEFNGEAVTLVGVDAPWVQFNIYDGANINSSPIYVQRSQVEVRAGRFQALIGPTGEGNVAFEDVVLGADDLYMTLTLLGDPDDDTDDVALSNPQRLLLSPHALYARGAADFDVANTLEVGGDATVNGDINAQRNININGVIIDPDSAVQVQDDLEVGSGGSGTLTVNGDIFASAYHLRIDQISRLSTVNGGGGAVNFGGDVTLGTNGDSAGDLVAGHFKPKYAAYDSGDTGDGRAAIVNDNESYQSLMILGNDSGGGVREVRMWDNVTVEERLHVKGRFTMNDVDVSPLGTEGCMKIGVAQMCWGQIDTDNDQGDADSDNFRRAFRYPPRVTLTFADFSVDATRTCHLRNVTSSSVAAACYNGGGDGRNGDIHYIAMGRATSGAW